MWNPDVKASDRNRRIEFAHNRHPVGLWHTHPERTPKPSLRDQKTTWQYLGSFRGDRSRYLLVTIGNHGIIPDMAVWEVTCRPTHAWIQLSEVN